MIQASGLTKVYRRGRRPAVFDLGFDVRPGSVTTLLGPEDAGKTTALRLMLQLEDGLGVTLFDGRTYQRLRCPEREVGVLLPTAHQGPGHPGRTARSHLRMLAAAIGVPVRRADELLEQTGLAGAADQRLRAFSVGMARRLGLATALLGDPAALLLDAPTAGLPGREVEWLHGFIRAFPGADGRSVLFTTSSPSEAALLADQVVTLADGQQVADQTVSEFRRTRLHPEVAVRGPQMARLTDVLTAQGAEVRPEGGVGLAVSGLQRTEIGELAYRHGIMLHELADRVVEQPAPPPTRSIQAPARPALAPTVQLRRMAAIAVRGPLALPRLRRAPVGRAQDASSAIELPPVPAPALPDDLSDAEVTILIRQSPAPDAVAPPHEEALPEVPAAASEAPLPAGGVDAVDAVSTTGTAVPAPAPPDRSAEALAHALEEPADTLAPSVAASTDTVAFPAVAVPVDTVAFPAVAVPVDTVAFPAVAVPVDTVAFPAVAVPADTVALPAVAVPADTIAQPAVAVPADTIAFPAVPFAETVALPAVPLAEAMTLATGPLADTVALSAIAPPPDAGALLTSPLADTVALSAVALSAVAAPVGAGEPLAVSSPAPVPLAHGSAPLAAGHDPLPLTGPDHWNG